MKNANLIFVLTATALVCLPGMATGYELSTHAGMTNVTYDKSILSVRSTYDRPGLTTRTQKRLGQPGKFTFPDKKEFGVRAWIMRGAIRENDTSATLSVLKTGSPRDDPDGNINRFCNHFFDPVNVRALSKFCFNSTLDMSPNWAIGTTDPFATPGQSRIVLPQPLHRIQCSGGDVAGTYVEGSVWVEQHRERDKR